MDKEKDPKNPEAPASQQPQGAVGEEKVLSPRRRDLLRVAVSAFPAAALVQLTGCVTPDRSPLVLEHKGLSKRAAALFDDLRNEAVRKTFIENPAELIVSRLLSGYHDQVPPMAISRANKFLFSSLANDNLREWSQRYQQELAASETQPDRSKVLRDFADALVEHGDRNMLFNLVARDGSSVSSIFVHTFAIAVHVAAIFIFVLTQIDATPLTDVRRPVETRLSPAELRSISRQLIEHAKRLSQSGELLV